MACARGRWTDMANSIRSPDTPEVEVLTPPGIIDVLKLGYLPFLHESARVSR